MIVLNQSKDMIKEIKMLKIKVKSVPANDDTKMYFDLIEQLNRSDRHNVIKPDNYEIKDAYCLIDEDGEELGVYDTPIEPLTILNSIYESKEKYIKL